MGEIKISDEMVREFNRAYSALWEERVPTPQADAVGPSFGKPVEA